MTDDSPRMVVATTVHHPDDNRIREKTIRALTDGFAITYACRSPGPTDTTDIEVALLSGGRLGRNWAVWRLALLHRYELLAIHDPELLPLGWVVRLLLRRPVIFDLHEDLPAQLLTKPGIPCVLRRPLALVARLVLRISERIVDITLAEDDYHHRFRRRHPVLSNLPAGLPPVQTEREPVAVYVGDLSVVRGVIDAVAACGRAQVPLVLIGSEHELGDRLRQAAEDHGTALTITGRLPHPEAMQRLGSASVALSPLHDIPNYRESLPTKILEYLALGVPVVASDLPATRRAVAGLDAVTLVPPGDIRALGAAIHSAMRPEQLRAAIAQAAAVRARFSWPAADVARIYGDLVMSDRR